MSQERNNERPIRVQTPMEIRGWRIALRLFCLVAALFSLAIPRMLAQPAESPKIIVEGRVLDAAGNPVGGAIVRLKKQGGASESESNASAAGAFEFSPVEEGKYSLTAETPHLKGNSAITVALAGGQRQRFTLTLRPGEDASAAGHTSSPDQTTRKTQETQAMAFADAPDFKVAGVTDWTAVGGHGSDSTLRTSEALARETITLKPDAAASVAASGARQANPSAEQADAHRLSGARAEKRGDPLAAVHEYEQAVKLDPSEQNYFAWGSELLLHRAVWQAQEVFKKGTGAYPKSERMQAALGTALFAGDLYDEAALRLCSASDLDPSAAEPYMFMGKVAMAAPTPLPCIEQRLASFAREQPKNASAQYFYAMAIWKRQGHPPDARDLKEVEALLTQAVAADSRCSDAYLQLGVLYFSQHDFAKAIENYKQAIEANPRLGEAYYRLGVAYDRIGEPARAKEEFDRHDQIEKLQAAAIEEQRREVKQFLVVLQNQPAGSQPQ